MAKKQEEIPDYKTYMVKGEQYYRTRIKDADGKQVALYSKTKEDLFRKVIAAQKIIETAKYHAMFPTVAMYTEKWLAMEAAYVRPSTLKGYRRALTKYLVEPLGEMCMKDVTADDLKLAMVPVSRLSAGTYNTVNMLVKSVFLSAEHSNVVSSNPAKTISPRGGQPGKKRNALTDAQAKCLLDSIREEPPYVFVMLGLYAGLRREEILGLKWDCVHLDNAVPYISVKRSWHVENGIAIVSDDLKTNTARRDIPIPKCLTDCLRKQKEETSSAYVISNEKGESLTPGEFQTLWNYVRRRTTKERTYQKNVNGQIIKYSYKPVLGQRSPGKKEIVYTLDFTVSPHQLRHTYITNLIYAGVDPKTVQYLAGHKNSKVTMDIYAKVKYNRPEELFGVINDAFENGSVGQKKDYDVGSPTSMEEAL